MELLMSRGCFAVSAIVLLLYILASAAYADVSMHNAYYTEGTVCYEQIFLHNMDYSNSVSISEASIYADAEARLSDADTGRFNHRTYMSSGGGAQGIDMKVSGRDLSYIRSLYGGIGYKSADLSYKMTSGDLQAVYFTPAARVAESISLDNSRYEADVGVYNFNLFSSGYGRQVADAAGGFKHDISLSYKGKECQIESFLKSTGSPVNQIPVRYSWEGFASYSASRGRAVSGLFIDAYAGNRPVDLGIKGTSTALSDKYSPDSYARGVPAHLPGAKPFWELYMQYAIT